MVEKKKWIGGGDLVGEYREDDKNVKQKLQCCSLFSHTRVYTLAGKTEGNFVCLLIQVAKVYRTQYALKKLRDFSSLLN